MSGYKERKKVRERGRIYIRESEDRATTDKEGLSAENDSSEEKEKQEKQSMLKDAKGVEGMKNGIGWGWGKDKKDRSIVTTHPDTKTIYIRFLFCFQVPPLPTLASNLSTMQ